MRLSGGGGSRGGAIYPGIFSADSLRNALRRRFGEKKTERKKKSVARRTIVDPEGRSNQ